MRVLSFDYIQKKLDKKNTELVKIRALRKKLDDKEKITSVDIENLQNQKSKLSFFKSNVKPKMKILKQSAISEQSLFHCQNS